MARRADRGERGSVMLVAFLALVGLLGLGAFTALNVQRGQSATSSERFEQIALYSAESGVAMAFEFLRANHDPSNGWAALLPPGNTVDETAAPSAGLTGSPPTNGIRGNNDLPGAGDNPFSSELSAYYKVWILNNAREHATDPGDDDDHTVVIKSVGFGPQNTRVEIRVTVRAELINSSPTWDGTNRLYILDWQRLYHRI